MEIVVSTPHGHADIDIVGAPPGTTLADLLRAVTGQAVPSTARIDGRATATSERISDLDLSIGTTIDTHSVDPYGDAYRNEVVRLVQITGRGAGRTIPLPPGRHRVGTARRLQADELERASVETPAFELYVDVDGATTVAPSDTEPTGADLGVYSSMLRDEPLDGERAWDGGRLCVAGRVFELDMPRPGDPPARRTKPAADGTIPFQRRLDGSIPGRRPVVDAARDAQRRSSRLWRRRRDDPDAFRLAYGLLADTVTDAVADLSLHVTTALVGSDRFTLALARTLLLEATTLHGPADLNVVVATTPERITYWNWVKWLPHARRGDPTSTPDLLCDDDALTRWASFASAPTAGAPRDSATEDGPGAEQWAPPAASSPATHVDDPVTILVIDDHELWSRRESPLQPLLAAPPPNLRIVTICTDIERAPGRATSFIEEVPPQHHLIDIATNAGSLRPALFGSLARQTSRLDAEPTVVDDVRPALADAQLAVRAARRLAPLDDLDALRRAPTPVRPAAPALHELVEDAIGPSFEVAIGAHVPDPASPPARYEPAMVDLTTTGPIAIVCADHRQGADTVAAVVLGAASRHSPERFAVLAISDERAAWQADLPHLAGWTRPDHDPARLVHRVAHVVTEQPDLHVLVVIDGALDPTKPSRAHLLDEFLSLSESVSEVHLLVTADSHDSISAARRSRLGSVVSIDAHGRGVLDDDESRTEFIAVTRRDDLAGRVDDRSPLVVRPTTHERAMTPLERRLLRVEAAQAVPDPDDIATALIARRIATRFVSSDDLERNDDSPRPLSLVPPPLPDDVDLARLMADFTGDGIPFGLVDRPERAETEASWWQPGNGGSILAVGSPRSGLTGLLDVLLIGIAARMSADDLHVYAIEALPQRRRALEALPHVGGVVAPDDSPSVERLVEALHAILLERTADRGDTDRPDIVLLAGDVGRIRRTLPPDAVEVVFDRLAEIAASGASVGMNVVVIGGRVEDLGALTRLSGDRLIGDVADPSERSRLGAPETSPAHRRVRRCWSTTSERLVQLATPPESVEAAVLDIGPEPAALRRPRLLVPGSAP